MYNRISFALCFALALPVQAVAQNSKSSVSPEAKAKAAGQQPGQAAQKPKEVVDTTEGVPSKAAEKEQAKVAPPSKNSAAGTVGETKEISQEPVDDGRAPINWRAASQQGPIGLDRVWSADPGPVGTVRMGFGLGWFSAEDFPADGTDNLFIGTDLKLGYTPHELVEAFLHVRGTSNTNEGGQPELLQTQGDLTFGAKVGAEITEGILLGGGFGVRMLSGLGEGGFVADATSLDLRFLATFDLQKLQQIPVRIYTDTGYFFENGEAVTDGLPSEPSLVQEYGLQVARYDRLTLALGVDSPFDRYFAPYMEYRISMPILVELARRGEGTNDYSFASIPHGLTLGFRGFPLDELALDLGVRLGLSDQPYTGVPATEPWMVMFGASYTLDPRPKVVRKVVEKQVKVPAAEPRLSTGVVAGRVIDAKTKQPIAGAQVAYPGMSALSPQSSSADGRFGGYQFPAGKVQIQAVAKGYKAKNQTAVVALGKTTQVSIALQRDPAQMKGRVEVRFFSQTGRPMAAKISFLGDAVGTMGQGTPKVPFKAELPAGRLMASVTAKGYPPQQHAVVVRGGETTPIRLTLRKPGKAPRFSAPPPRRPRVTAPGVSRPMSPGPSSAGGRKARVSLRGIQLFEKVAFAAGESALNEQGRAVLDEVASGLKKVTRIERVRIAVHTGGGGSRAQELELSNARSRAVKSYLVSQGIEPKRLQARGYGKDKPKGLGLTARAKARNERVEFVILKKR